jgi:hypothetical protein
MSDSPIAPPAQPTIIGNPYIVACLRVTLGEKGWSFPRLVKAMRWHHHPAEWLAGVAELAQDLGLIAPVKPKAKKQAKPTADEPEEPLILPVPLRPQPSKPANIIKLSDRREPAPWTVDSTPEAGENDHER